MFFVDEEDCRACEDLIDRGFYRNVAKEAAEPINVEC